MRYYRHFFAQTLAYIGIFAGLLCLKIILTALYNVYLHPLRKYPGPKSAAATNFIFHYKGLTGEEAKWLHQLHQRYGAVVRVSPDRLTYIDSQAWKDITGHHTGRPEHVKDGAVLKPHHNGIHSISGIPDTSQHRQRRKYYNHAFSDKALKLQDPLILGHVNTLIKNLRNASESGLNVKTNLVRHFNFITFDVVGDLVFGESLGLLDAAEYTPWIKGVCASFEFMAIARFLGEYPIVGLPLSLVTSSTRRQSKEHFDNTAERMDQRLKRGVDAGKPDIWKFVLEKNGQSGLTNGQMKADASTFMRAGTETTATALSGAVFFLLTNPDKMKKLVEEIRSLKRDNLSSESLQRCVYLNACLSETLRIYPPAPVPSFRRVGKGGSLICGQWVPEQMRVGVAMHAAYHSTLNFRDPDKFIPERWLPGTGYDDDKKDVLNPFAYGPRNCIGKNLANHEMRVILASLLWHFDLQLCPESSSWADQKVFLTWDKGELWVKPKYIR